MMLFSGTLSYWQNVSPSFWVQKIFMHVLQTRYNFSEASFVERLIYVLAKRSS